MSRDERRHELEPGEIIEAEIGRLVSHRRAEIVPLVLILVCITLIVYFKA